jgi:hypothetical protein
MANEGTDVIGMLGSGGMSRTHLQAFNAVRTIKKLEVFSPTKANREKFAEEMRHRDNIEVNVCDKPQDIYKGAHNRTAVSQVVCFMRSSKFAGIPRNGDSRRIWTVWPSRARLSCRTKSDIPRLRCIMSL